MLNGWKAIAAYLRRDERTAMRWAAERGLPVYRTPGAGRGSVHALAEEIDAWLNSAREPVMPPAPASAAPVPAAVLASVSAATSAEPIATRRWGLVVAVLVALGLVGAAAVVTRRPTQPLDGGQPGITDPAARAAYLQATYDWNLRTRDSLTRAVREYGDAIEQDPRAAPAYVGLANTYLLLREDGSMDDAQAYPRAEAAAKAATALAPQSAAAHRALAFVAFWWRHDRPAARAEFARAIALDPADPLTHHWFATALAANGEYPVALREITRARELDPTASSIVADQGLLAYLAGHRSDGLAMLHAVVSDQPQAVGPHRALADIALAEGRGTEFVTEAATAARLRGDKAQAAALGRLRSNDTGAIAAALLRDARADTARTGAGWFQVARIASLAGRRAEADDALGRACRANELARVAAAGDLWLSRTLSRARIAALCGGGSLEV